MKTIFAAFVTLSTLTIAAAQNKFESFNQQKKSRDLCTGICMSYIETGNPNGTPVLLLHGYTDTSRSFQLVIEDLLKTNSNLRIIAPDLRGHGQTSMPDESQCIDNPEVCFSPGLFAEDIVDLMDQLEIKDAHIVGHSLGSIIAQTLALSYSERVSSMILIGTFVSGKSCSTIHDFLKGELVERDWRCLLEQEQQKADWPGDAYSFLPLNLGDRVVNYLRENWLVETGAARDFLDAIFPETITIPMGTWIGTIRGLADVDNRKELQNLTTPTLILWGMHDSVADSTDQVKVKTAFDAAVKSSCTRVEYKIYGKHTPAQNNDSQHQPGHNLHWAAHQAVSEDINSFIADNLTGSRTAAESH